jgi:hypothetical protein
MRSNYDFTVGSVNDSATQIPIEPGIGFIDLGRFIGEDNNNNIPLWTKADRFLSEFPLDITTSKASHIVE